jgi:hypothetical protein
MKIEEGGRTKRHDPENAVNLEEIANGTTANDGRSDEELAEQDDDFPVVSLGLETVVEESENQLHVGVFLSSEFPQCKEDKERASNAPQDQSRIRHSHPAVVFIRFAFVLSVVGSFFLPSQLNIKRKKRKVELTVQH